MEKFICQVKENVGENSNVLIEECNDDPIFQFEYEQPENRFRLKNTKYRLAIDADNNTFYTPAVDKEEITFDLPKPKRITKINLKYKSPAAYNIFFFYNGQKNMAVSAGKSTITGFIERSHNITNSNLIEKVIIEFTPLTDLYEVEIEGRDKN